MEYLKFAFTGVNILPSIMVLIIIFYWMMAIFGAFGHHFHHKVDFHHLHHGHDINHAGGDDATISESIASTSLPKQILTFINIGAVPLMLYMTILVLCIWTISMCTYYLHLSPKSLIAALLLPVNIFVSLFITKLITEPMKPIFAMFDRSSKMRIEGAICVIKHETDETTMGQADIEELGGILINVISVEGVIKKGDKAYVLEKREGGKVYLVRKIIDFHLDI